jgi:hypothetical protein
MPAFSVLRTPTQIGWTIIKIGDARENNETPPQIIFRLHRPTGPTRRRHMGACSSKAPADVVVTKPQEAATDAKVLAQPAIGADAPTPVVDETPPTPQAGPAPTAPAAPAAPPAVAKAAIADAYYESLGLVKTGPVSWRTADSPPAAPPVAPPVAEPPVSRWQQVKDTVGAVAPSREGLIGSTALWLYGMISARGQSAAPKAEERCAVCTFRHWQGCAQCPRCGN